MADSVRPAAARKRRTARLVLYWVGGSILGLLVAAFIAGEIVVHRAAPFLKAKVVETLSTRFDSRVELDRFHVGLFPGLTVSGSGLRLYPRRLAAPYPLLAVKQFRFHTGWQNLMRSPMDISRVEVQGLALHIPPKSERAQIPRASQAKRAGQNHIEVEVHELVADDATLTIENGKPGKVPLQFEIHNLRLTSVAAGRAMQFKATLVNPKPVGDIACSGSFGPFQIDDPGDTPVSGVYSFRDANLGTLKGIAGTLSSNGKYTGTLEKIDVEGETATPDFRLDLASHPLPLNTTFHAIVDGANGNTYLQPVDAWLLHSHIVARGEVVRAAGHPGHDIRLDVVVGPARMEDILQLGSPTEPPLLTGDVHVQTKLDLPPGHERVMDKLQLQGSFEVENAHFTSEKFQSKVDQLSLRGLGKAKLAKQEKQAEKDGDDPGAETDVASRIAGQFQFGDGRIQLRNLEFQVPGALIGVNGVYTLQGDGLDFRGAARLDAKISQMVTGWKSILLKPFNGIFAKSNGTTVVPIDVTGTRSDPHFGLNFHH